ncbi:GNAT family N-acetyltransferase [Aquimarina algiphila]|uniref:GNAT family N-acetyltransferase n=1 Tax=Aquimarina algiphila TaxID=2047982 RepID=A0A554VE70_9FLAO|nr:GNAT family N-acetyltransferase [Aquimarina algiphila]TSE05277.1 GNAT family N-acetyltransferase [Aquimarina algiphila]
MKFIKTDDIVVIDKFREELYQKFSAPIDAMWEKLYIASSQTYLIEHVDQNIGYCCIDDKGSLLQIFLSDKYNYLMYNVIQSLIESKLISSASLSSIEPVSFNACLSHSKSIQTNTLCFQYVNRKSKNESSLDVKLVSERDTQGIKTFLMDQIGFEDDFGYTENLIQRKEFYMVKESETIIATGECRLSDSQLDIADLGIIVNKDYQKRGLGTEVLQQLVKKAQVMKRKPICSTTQDNIASRKAIEKAGFYCSHIIFDINFKENKIQL